MPLWQIALILFVAAWALQSLGVWMQMRGYQKAFRELRLRWSDGKLGAGAAPSKAGKGAIAVVVVDPDNVVRTIQVMQGRTVFARLKPFPGFDGASLESLKEQIAAGAFERGVGAAIAKAIEQVEKVGGGSGGAARTASGMPEPA